MRFVATPMWQPVGDVPKYGIAPLIVGTLKVVILAMLFAVPIGLLAAVFASEFAPAARARGPQAGRSSSSPASRRWCSDSSP